jgi:hypothetical protein
MVKFDRRGRPLRGDNVTLNDFLGCLSPYLSRSGLWSCDCGIGLGLGNEKMHSWSWSRTHLVTPVLVSRNWSCSHHCNRVSEVHSDALFRIVDAQCLVDCKSHGTLEK